MRSVLIIVSVLIVYGSLYPFDFQLPHDSEIQAIMGALFDPFAARRGDLLGNIALFVPFGFAGAFAINPGRRAAQLTLVILSGAFLALLVQVLQFFVPQRDPSLVDVFWNVAGLGLGLGAAAAPPARRVLSSIGERISFEVPVMLAGIWLASELMPLVPSLDFQLLKQNLKPLLQAPEFRVGEAILHFAGWLVALRFLASSKLLKNWTMLLLALPFLVMAVQPFILNNGLSLAELTGAVGGVAVWAIARNSLRPALLAALLVIAILASNLYPFSFDSARNAFSWVPFSDFLEGNMAANAASFVRKAFLYGALVWLLREMGLGWKNSTIFTCMVLLAQETLQVYVPGAAAGLTDPILALLMAMAMYAASRGSQRSSAVVPASVGADRRHMRRNSLPPAPQDQTASVWHLGSLDGLRGLAALAVFGVHFNQAAHLHGTAGPFDLDRFLTNGNTGVALFFVLSGFLLSIPFWRALQEPAKPVDTKAYAIRRLARIVPAYYACLFIIISAKGLFGSWPNANDLLSHLLFLHNLKDYNILSINPPFWTLAVEMQFYLLLPLLFLGLRRLPSGVAFALVLFLCVGTYLANYGVVSFLLALNHWPINIGLIWPFAIAITGPDSFVLTYSTFAHLTFFLAGLAAAWLFLRSSGGAGPKTQFAWGGDVVFWSAALALLVILSTPLDNVLQLPLGHFNWPISPLLLAAMVLTAPRAKTARAIFDHGPARWLGLISYGVYIYHYPVLRVTETAMAAGKLSVTAHWFLFGALSFAGTIVIASLSYVLLEKPIMQAARRRRLVQKEIAAAGQEPLADIQKTPRRAQVRAKGWAEVPIGLRSEQVTYLEEASLDRARSLSSATRHIIGQFIARLSQEGLDDQTSHDRLAASRIRMVLERHGHEHQHIVNLPNDYVEFLSGLSAKLGTTTSRTVQMIVDDFIMENTQKEKTGPVGEQAR